ncbi:hypothetical protein L6R50_21400 [Myxococcota bacterium]|nr:hypothetical protein [Myxococcota bacterium]
MIHRPAAGGAPGRVRARPRLSVGVLAGALCLFAACGGGGEGAAEREEASRASSPPRAGAATPPETPSPAAAPGVAGGPPAPGAVDPAGLADTPELGPADEARAAEALRRVAREGASDPDNPWAMAHGILAWGGDFRARGGERAVGRIVSTWLEERTVPDPGADSGVRVVHGFPARRGEVRVEPHADLVLKNAIERDAFPEGPFGAVPGAPSRVELVRDSQATFAFRGGGGGVAFPRPDDVAWSVQAYCQEAERAGDRWTGPDGRAVRLGEVAAAMLQMLEDSTRFLAEARGRGEDRIQKRRQGIFGFTCGGAHLFQGVAACAAAGYPGPEARARVAEQASLYLWRAGVEVPLYAESIAKAPKLAPLLINQEVKFLGHMLEGLGNAEREGVWSPTAEEAEVLAGARRRLLRAALRLEETGVYAQLAGIRAGNEQFYLDLVGDSCHAVRALDVQAQLGRGAVAAAAGGDSKAGKR